VEAYLNHPAKLVLGSALISLCFITAPTRAHEAVTGWMYPAQCCSEMDCGHAISASRNADGSLTVTTQHGTATFPANFKYDPSPDGLIHACFTPGRLYCLYLATGS
jgi:hypothetical protein